MTESLYTDRPELDLQTAALKVPPHSIEAEQAVLGGVMLDNMAWERVAEQLTDSDFYRHDHRLIFQALVRLASRNLPFDVVTLAEELDKEGLTDQVGGLAYLGQLAKIEKRNSDALRYFSAVVKLDPYNIEAKREIRLIEMRRS